MVLVALLIALYVAWWSRERYNKVLAAHNRDLDKHLESNKRLLSLIAHDFRTPMKSMNSMLDLIEHNKLSEEELKEISKKTRNHIRTTLRGMDQMLLWITKDKKEVSIQTNRLQPLLQEVKEFFSWELESLNATLNIASLDDHVMRFDSGHLEAIARNIVGNSLKYCKEGCIIDVSYSQSATEETLSFHDNGPGIDEKTLAQIQSRTFRSLLPHQNKRSSSTGLGLELEFELADLNDARVVVDSTLGQGTSVSIVRKLD